MAEIQDLGKIVLMFVLVGMILGVGILIPDKFSIAAKDSTIIINETVVFTAGAGTTANDDVSSITRISNNSADARTCTTFNTAAWCANYTTAGAIIINVSTFVDLTGNYNVSYVYDKDTSAYTATTNTNTALSTIASTWLSLIITIVVLAIILTLVIRSFTGAGR